MQRRNTLKTTSKKKCVFVPMGKGTAHKRATLALKKNKVSEEKAEKIKKDKEKRLKEWKSWF